MARTSNTITLATLALLGTLAPAAFAQAGDDGERVFGRVGPERPVVEIPAEQRNGVDADTPPEGWEVHDPSRVIEAEQNDNAATDEDVVDAALSAIADATADEPMGPPAPEPQTIAEIAEAAAVTLASTEEKTTGADTVVPYVAPENAEMLAARPLGGDEGEPLAAGDTDAEPKPWWADMGRTAIALGLVLGLILLLAFIYTRLARSRGSLMAAGGGRAPAGVLEVLGRYPVGPRQTMMLIKFDKRVLLVTQTTPRSGPPQMTTLCELTEPEDVASVLGKVRDASGDSMNETFRAAMDRAGVSAAPTHGATPQAPEFMPEPVAAVTEPKPAFDVDYDPEDLRRTVGGSEEERAQLWEDMGSSGTGRDPIGSLRRRLNAMRGGVPR